MLNITGARRSGKQKNLELNMAPLIDMVFILLIFFLVTTSFVKETGVDISRPRLPRLHAVQGHHSHRHHPGQHHPPGPPGDRHPGGPIQCGAGPG